MKRLLPIFLSAAVLVGSLGGCQASQQPEPASSAPLTVKEEAAISFTDADGREISLDKPCERIISLYSAHTENLYSLGAGDKLIGAHKTSIYPPEANDLPRFHYNSDPETIIAAEPDCVLIRPFITHKVPDFVKALEQAGIPVVSLYPVSLDTFDDYIRNLAMLTGKESAAEEKLTEFHQNLAEITDKTAAVTEKQSVFFESTEVNLRTVTPDSMAGLAIDMAGGTNIAADGKPINDGSSISSYGIEKILEHADDIDVYVSQRGAMNAGGNLHSILIRPGFDTIKAVQDKRVYVINEKLISSPTFRYYKGVRELARYLYPDLMDDVQSYHTDTAATKRDLANILVRTAHMPVYVPSSSKYYTQSHTGHVYGLFEDVTWQDTDFDFIETAAISGAVGWEADGDLQYFRPDAPVTREMLAKAIYILYDYSAKDQKTPISDLEQCEQPNIVQTLVDHDVFSMQDGKFEPQATMTCGEIAEILEKLPAFTQVTGIE